MQGRTSDSECASSTSSLLCSTVEKRAIHTGGGR